MGEDGGAIGVQGTGDGVLWHARRATLQRDLDEWTAKR